MKEEEKKESNKWVILFTVLVMTFMVTLDGSIVNVAMPVMGQELNVGMGGIEWVASIYLVITCATILIFGRLGDMIGKVRIFQTGVMLFTIGSLFCSISHSLPLLIGARVVQGLGAAAALAANQGIITETFPSHQRGKALGFVSTFVALGSMAGPTIGGFILTLLPWEYIFLINVPVGVLAFLVGLRVLPNRKPAAPGKLDGKGGLLLFISIVMIFGSITLMQDEINLPILAALIIGILLVFLFIREEGRTEEPLIPLEVFKNKLFSLNMFTLLLVFTALGAYNIILPFYLQDALKFSPGVAGMFLTVIPFITAFIGPLSGSLSDRIGCEKPTMIGLLFYTLGLAMFLGTGLNTAPLQLVLCLVVIAVGSGLFQSPNNSLIMGSVPRSELGFVGSFTGLMRNMGISIGLTAGTTLLYNRMSAKVGYHVTSYVTGRDDVFIYGMHWVYAVMSIIMFIGAMMSVIRFLHSRGQTKGTPDQTKQFSGKETRCTES